MFTVEQKESAVMVNHLSNGEPSAKHQRGFTYLGVLIAVALLGVGLSIVSEIWTKTAEHQKIVQLEWIGNQYVQGIESYYYANTGSVHFYPEDLDDLLVDKRYLYIRRHIRTLYPDPFTGKLQWKLIPAPTGGFKGVEFSSDEPDMPMIKEFIFTPINGP
jgi:type II secretory pathway pseudopilin PulG